VGEDKLLAEWFWIDRWMGSSAFLLPLEARGLYREMLSQAWRRRATLPASHEAIRRAVGCSEKEWKRAWPSIARFWVADGDTLYNETQRTVYADCMARAESLSERGRKGGLRSGANRKPKSNSSSTQVEATRQAVGQADGQANGQLAGKPPDPSPEPEPPPKNGGGVRAVGVGLIRSSVDRGKALRFNAFAGSRLDVPHKIHGDFVRALGGDNPDGVLKAWYAELDAEVEMTRESFQPDIWKWLEARFKQWLSARSGDAEMAKFLQGA
jgi:uncharacterized protein YdaU (DUF1376 family)